jgi:DNA-binding CsgD family transcriptional regulator
MRKKLRFVSASLSLVDLHSGDALLDIMSSAYPAWIERMPKNRRDLVEIWGGMDKMQSLPLGEPLILSRLRDRSIWETNSLYKIMGRLLGIRDILAIGLARDSTMLASLAFIRHVSAGDIRDTEIEAARLVIPHMQRTVAISRLLDLECVVTSAFETILDALRCGVVLTNETGKITYVNRSAEHMLVNGHPICTADGILTAKTPAAAQELHAAIRLAVQDEVNIGKTGLAICLTEPDETPMFAHVLPMNGSDLRVQIRPEAIAAVFVGAESDPQKDASMLALAFGLTPAETRVLASLLAGRRLVDTASFLDIAMTTAKTHLDNIFSKTGVSRQAELFRLVTRVVPTVRSRD